MMLLFENGDAAAADDSDADAYAAKAGFLQPVLLLLLLLLLPSLFSLTHTV